jgi:hypothetical protein
MFSIDYSHVRHNGTYSFLQSLNDEDFSYLLNLMVECSDVPDFSGIDVDKTSEDIFVDIILKLEETETPMLRSLDHGYTPCYDLEENIQTLKDMIFFEEKARKDQESKGSTPSWLTYKFRECCLPKYENKKDGENVVCKMSKGDGLE